MRQKTDFFDTIKQEISFLEQCTAPDKWPYFDQMEAISPEFKDMISKYNLQSEIKSKHRKMYQSITRILEFIEEKDLPKSVDITLKLTDIASLCNAAISYGIIQKQRTLLDVFGDQDYIPSIGKNLDDDIFLGPI